MCSEAELRESMQQMSAAVQVLTTHVYDQDLKNEARFRKMDERITANEHAREQLHQLVVDAVRSAMSEMSVITVLDLPNALTNYARNSFRSFAKWTGGAVLTIAGVYVAVSHLIALLNALIHQIVR